MLFYFSLNLLWRNVSRSVSTFLDYFKASFLDYFKKILREPKNNAQNHTVYISEINVHTNKHIHIVKCSITVCSTSVGTTVIDLYFEKER